MLRTFFSITLFAFCFGSSSTFATISSPYNEEEVLFHNKEAHVTLSGTLTLPHATGPFPVVILLHGSAPLDRDSTLFGHKPFYVWADHLTKQGIAVLRFDKRSAGKSTGDYSISTLEDFAADALAGVEYLKTRNDINQSQIGLIGHSEGGMTAALAASQSKDVAFIVSMAAPSTSWDTVILTQIQLLLQVDDVSQKLIANYQELLVEVFALLKQEPDQKERENRLREMLSIYFNQLTPSEKETIEKHCGPFEGQVQLLNSSWFCFNLTYDPTATLKKVTVPVLALNGELDFVVPSKQNLSQIASALEEAGNQDYTVRELPQLNHAFQTCKKGSRSEYAEIEETTSAEALNSMSSWILERTSTR